MDRTERLLALIAGLVNAKRPVTWAEIRTWFPADYEEPSEETALRKFERDKKDLLDLGIPLQYDAEEDEEGGYAVDVARLYLPALQLTPEEAASLYLAGSELAASPGFPYRDALATALQKIEMAPDGEPLRDQAATRHVLVEPPAPHADSSDEDQLERIGDAIAAQKSVSFTYHALTTGETTRRTVDPYGLFCWRGDWMLVGRCHMRDAVRSFFVRRTRELTTNPQRRGTPDFAVPRDFRLRDFVAVPPWRWEVHEPVALVIEVHPERASMAERDLRVAGSAVAEGWRRFRFDVTHADAVAAWLQGLGPWARVVSPTAIRAKVDAGLAAVAARHEGG